MTEADEVRARRFGGVGRLYGAEGAQAIAQAHVVIVGIGGVGSWAAEAVARFGVGHITLIDMDHLSESNINRQFDEVAAGLTEAEVEAMAQRIAQINPLAHVKTVDDFIDPDNVATHLAPLLHAPGSVAVIDACDQLKAKVALAAWALSHRVPLAVVGAAGGKRLPHLVQVADLAEVTHDPLLASMRQRLRQRHGAARSGKMQISCVFSKEPVLQSQLLCETTQEQQSDNSLNCHGYGSSVGVTSVFGFVAASWIINQFADSLKK